MYDEPDYKTFDCISVVTSRPSEDYVPVEVKCNKIGIVAVIFKDTTSIIIDTERGVDLMVENLLLFGEQYYIYKELQDELAEQNDLSEINL